MSHAYFSSTWAFIRECIVGLEVQYVSCMFQLILDSQRPTQKELDTVAVLQAIQKSKQGKDSAKKHAMKKVRPKLKLFGACNPFSQKHPYRGLAVMRPACHLDTQNTVF